MAAVIETNDSITIWDNDEYGVDEINEEDVVGYASEEENVGVNGFLEENIECPENVRPFIGMEFSSVDEAEFFYKSYGGRLGFSVRRNTHTKSKAGISSLRMVCSKQGLSKRQEQDEMGTEADGNANLGTPQKEMPKKRDGCGAYIRFRRLKNGTWQVSAFVAEHNHTLIGSPSKKRNLRSLKGMTLVENQIIKEMRAQNVSASQIWHYLVERAGGVQNLTYGKKDVGNIIGEENKKLVGVDVETTLIYFCKKQEEDPEFFFAIEPDENGVVMNILWIDGRSRRAYQEFGDVVTFDTTYNTNKYFMPLGAFIGANHHWHSIFYGCCLLRNEQATNFVWLFKTWKQAMYNKAPISIITDQDPAMAAAIKEIFPKIVHRRCLWHVMRKARQELLVHYSSKEGFENELKAIINRSLTVGDFESSWEKMLDKYEMHNNSHLKLIFNKRDEWVPVYFRGTFFANMKTTQRSEGMNAFMKLLVDSHTCIYRFVLQLEKLVQGIWQKESDENCRDMIETPQLWSWNNMEVDARRVYIRNIFALFKKILKESSNGVVVENERDKFCKGFKFTGLLCAHAIKVMQHVGMQNLPSKYIIKHWTKGANENVKRSIKETCMNKGESTQLESMRHSALYPKFMEILHMATKSGEAFELVNASLDEIKAKIVPMGVSTNNAQSTGGLATGVRIRCHTTATAISSQQEISPSVEYTDPPLSQCKGRKRPQRLKSFVEQIAPKRRTCSYCNEQEGHNLRTCPKRVADCS